MAALLDSMLRLTSEPVLAAVLGLTVLLFYVLESSRWLLAPLFLQFAALGLLLATSVEPLIAPVWLILGLCVTGLFAASGSLSPARTGLSNQTNLGMGLLYDAASLLLSGLVSYALWRVRPVTAMPAATNLACYWLCACGLLLLLQRRRAIYALGAVSLLNGALGIYLHTETSLLVLAIAALLCVLAGYVTATLPLRADGGSE